MAITRSSRGTTTDESGKSGGLMDALTGRSDARSKSGSDGSSRGPRDAPGNRRDDERSPVSEFGERVLRIAEDAVYVVVAILLVVGALVLLVDAAGELGGLDKGADTAVLALLDRLLLVFVLVELIFAVRMTLTRREIVAEPFLIVGIIASIKEIILLSVEAANVLEGKATTEGVKDPQQFALLIALLGLLVVVLASSAVLLRLKERQPIEGKQNEKRAEDADGDGKTDDVDPDDLDQNQP